MTLHATFEEVLGGGRSLAMSSVEKEGTMNNGDGSFNEDASQVKAPQNSS